MIGRYIRKHLEYEGSLRSCRRATLCVLLVAVCLMALELAGCKMEFGAGKKHKDDRGTAVPVKVQPAARGDIANSLRYNSVVEPDKQVQVLARASGAVLKVYVEEGAWVGQGQILLKIDDTEAGLNLERAQAAADRQSVTLKRAEEMFAREMLAKDELEQTTLALRDAELNLKQADLSLTYTAVRSPFSGTVVERLVSEGDQISPGCPLFSVVDRSRLRLNCWVSEKDLQHLIPGIIADVESDVWVGQLFRAELERLSPVVDTKYGKVKAVFRLLDPDEKLKPGQFVELRLVTQTHSQVLLAPKQAVIYEAGTPVVFVARDSLAFHCPVNLGLETADLVELVSGVAEGDQIVIEGQATLKDSTRVKIIP